MKAIGLHAVTTVGIIAVSLGALPAIAASQACPPLLRGEKVPISKHSQAPQILIPTIHGPGELAANFSFALRARLALITDEKDLWVIPCQTFDSAMAGSGYKPDSALAPNDFAALGQFLRAQESIDGTIWKTPDSKIHADIKLYYLNNVHVWEPLPEVVGKDYEDVATKVADLYKTARKEFEPYARCSNLARDRKGDSALVFARLAHAAYPTGYMPTLCLLNAWSVVPNAPPDSLMAAAQAVYAVDSVNRFAVRVIAYAYGAKADTADAVRMWIKFYELDHSDVAGAQTVIGVLAQSGAPDKALPIIDQLRKTSPTDTGLLRTKVRILLDAGRSNEAYPVFDTLMIVDTSQAVRTMLQRMIGAAQRDSNLKVILRYEADNAKRFPKDAEAWEVYGGTLFRAGELQQALEAGKHAVAVDPKIPDGFGFVFTVYRRLNWPDSAVAYAKQALKAGADSTLIGQQMVSVIGPYAQKADSLTHTEDPGAKAAWQSVFDVALKIDSVVPGTPTKYFMGLAAAQMGLIGLKHVQQLGDLAKTNKAEACRQMTEIDDLLTSARVNITAGGSFDKAAAGSIMTLVMTDQPQLQAYKASICK